MSDYISRENALFALDDFLDSEQEYGIIADCYSEADVDKARKRIMCIPSAVEIDVTEVKHGKWLDINEILMPTHRYDEFSNPFSIFFATCSVCRIATDNDGCLNGYSYCPHCGAKMSVDITGDELVEKLWNEFTDIPIDPVTERLETNFYGFAARTSKLSVWAWFNNYHSKGIEYLLYEYEAKE